MSIETKREHSPPLPQDQKSNFLSRKASRRDILERAIQYGSLVTIGASLVDFFRYLKVMNETVYKASPEPYTPERVKAAQEVKEAFWNETTGQIKQQNTETGTVIVDKETKGQVLEAEKVLSETADTKQKRDLLSDDFAKKGRGRWNRIMASTIGGLVSGLGISLIKQARADFAEKQEQKAKAPITSSNL